MVNSNKADGKKSDDQMLKNIDRELKSLFECELLSELSGDTIYKDDVRKIAKKLRVEPDQVIKRAIFRKMEFDNSIREYEDIESWPSEVMKSVDEDIKKSAVNNIISKKSLLRVGENNLVANFDVSKRAEYLGISPSESNVDGVLVTMVDIDLELTRRNSINLNICKTIGDKLQVDSERVIQRARRRHLIDDAGNSNKTADYVVKNESTVNKKSSNLSLFVYMFLALAIGFLAFRFFQDQKMK